MTRLAPVRSLLLTALVVSLSGCALLPKSGPLAKLRPSHHKTAVAERNAYDRAGLTPSDTVDRAVREAIRTGRAVSPAEGYYQTAVAAVDRRDYAAALEALQRARARDPSDARVPNGFGVVYDKLGRFDLSARYYAEAQAMQPDSAVIASNIAYSRLLQQRANAPLPAPAVELAAAAPQPAPAPTAVASGPRLVAAGRNVLRLELPVQTAEAAPVIKTPPAAVASSPATKVLRKALAAILPSAKGSS